MNTTSLATPLIISSSTIIRDDEPSNNSYKHGLHPWQIDRENYMRMAWRKEDFMAMMAMMARERGEGSSPDHPWIEPSRLPRKSQTQYVPVVKLCQPDHEPIFADPCTVNLDEIDIITQCSIAELFKTHLAKELDLILIRIPTTKEQFKLISLPETWDAFECMFSRLSSNYFTREPWGAGHDIIFFIVKTKKVRNPEYIEAYRMGTLADLNTQRKHNPEPTGDISCGRHMLESIQKIYSPKTDNATTSDVCTQSEHNPEPRGNTNRIRRLLNYIRRHVTPTQTTP